MNLDKNKIFLESEYIGPTHFLNMIDFAYQDSYTNKMLVIGAMCH